MWNFSVEIEMSDITDVIYTTLLKCIIVFFAWATAALAPRLPRLCHWPKYTAQFWKVKNVHRRWQLSMQANRRYAASSAAVGLHRGWLGDCMGRTGCTDECETIDWQALQVLGRQEARDIDARAADNDWLLPLSVIAACVRAAVGLLHWSNHH